MREWPLAARVRGCGLLCLLGAAAAAVGGEADVPDTHHDPGIELPAGPGREALLDACTRCHDLKGLPAYRPYWNRDRWRSMVETMTENGAPLDEAGQQQVVDYLTRHFGIPDP